MTRLVEDSGCSITGMPADCGSSAMASFTRSRTSWRAVMRSVPRLKSSMICDSACDRGRADDVDVGNAAQRSSIGMVMSSSTSAEVIPGPSVWISTFGGANSGKTSTGILRSSRTPNSTMPMPMASTRKRNLRLDPTIQANTQTPPTLGSRFLLGPSTRSPQGRRFRASVMPIRDALESKAV